MEILCYRNVPLLKISEPDILHELVTESNSERTGVAHETRTQQAITYEANSLLFEILNLNSPTSTLASQSLNELVGLVKLFLHRISLLLQFVGLRLTLRKLLIQILNVLLEFGESCLNFGEIFHALVELLLSLLNHSSLWLNTLPYLEELHNGIHPGEQTCSCATLALQIGRIETGTVLFDNGFDLVHTSLTEEIFVVVDELFDETHISHESLRILPRWLHSSFAQQNHNTFTNILHKVMRIGK
mmetsp:Transcript_10515/g.39097  ORF Transcript_10515/g.39097 Transcript_10515/m.39097 type:complete len:244 (-) Transcript_10515:10046-10777(-)